MSVTFSVIGAPFDYANGDDPCHYNVANGSARRILRDMLHVESEYLCGELDPHEVLRRLAVVRPEAHTEEGYDRQHERTVIDENGVGVRRGPRVIFQGISEERVERWVDGLRGVAQAAIQADQRISFV